MMVQGYTFTPEMWKLKQPEKDSFLRRMDRIIENASGDLDHFRMYKSLRNDVDLIFWYSSYQIEPLIKFKFKILEGMSGLVTNSFGSFSIYRESPYVKEGEDLLGTLKKEPLPYFVAYPMSKENSWYQLDYEERKRIMAEHIGVALSHSDNRNIRSYTTYSFGISDGEFMVIYEVDNFSKWSNVTSRLREVRAREWIRNENPILTGMYTTSLTQ